MLWYLTVTFQEGELRDEFWEQAPDLPHIAAHMAIGDLRTRYYTARPAVAFIHHRREVLATLARYTLDFWPSAQINLSLGEPDTSASVYLETGS